MIFKVAVVKKIWKNKKRSAVVVKKLNVLNYIANAFKLRDIV